MRSAFSRYVEPWCDPIKINKFTVNDWAALMKKANEARKWANPNCTPEMIVECDRKIRQHYQKMK